MNRIFYRTGHLKRSKENPKYGGAGQQEHRQRTSNNNEQYDSIYVYYWIHFRGITQYCSIQAKE